MSVRTFIYLTSLLLVLCSATVLRLSNTDADKSATATDGFSKDGVHYWRFSNQNTPITTLDITFDIEDEVLMANFGITTSAAGNLVLATPSVTISDTASTQVFAPVPGLTRNTLPSCMAGTLANAEYQCAYKEGFARTSGRAPEACSLTASPATFSYPYAPTCSTLLPNQSAHQGNGAAAYDRSVNYCRSDEQRDAGGFCVRFTTGVKSAEMVTALSVGGIVVFLALCFVAFVIYYSIRGASIEQRRYERTHSKIKTDTVAATSGRRRLHLRKRRALLPAELASQPRFQATLERLCSEAGIPIADLRATVAATSDYMVEQWSCQDAPALLAKRIFATTYAAAPASCKQLKSMTLPNEIMAPPTEELLLSEMHASPYYVLCNPLNYRGTAWPFPAARSMFDKLFAFQDDVNNVEDYSITIVRRLYENAVAERSDAMRRTLARGTAEELAKEPSLAKPLACLLESANNFTGAVEVKLASTDKTVQTLCDLETLTRAARNAPLHLAGAIRAAPGVAQVATGNALEAIRICADLALTETATIVPALRNDLAAGLRAVGAGRGLRATVLARAISVQVAGPFVATVLASVRANAGPKLTQYLNQTVSECLIGGAERFIMPFVLILNTGIAKKITFDSSSPVPIQPPAYKSTGPGDQPTRLPPLGTSTAPGSVTAALIKAVAARHAILCVPGIKFAGKTLPHAYYTPE